MWFKDDVHRDTYEEYMEKAGVISNCEYSSALYLLAAVNKDLSNYVSEDGIRFPKLLKEAKAWSNAELALIKLANNLFNGRTKANVRDIFWSLDQYNTKAAIEAIAIRFM
jgi:hypothetical protein